MAAVTCAGATALVDLRRIRADSLNDLLEEETQHWKDLLDWDFASSADLVRRFVRMKSLSGWVLAAGNRPIGYSYFVCEDAKGLIGDLYILDRYRSAELEYRLLTAVLDSLFAASCLHRVEAQLMTLSSPFDRALPRSDFVGVHARNFMVIPLEAAHSLPPGKAADQVRVERFTHSAHEEAARLIAASYRGHVDGEINDQYRSVSGARRFLSNIVQYPGCGSFFPPGSLVAVLPDTGELAGVSLSSLVAGDVGHITQVCTLPAARRRGIAYELVRRSLLALAWYGCRKASLTVTSSNTEAVRLYERMGFSTTRVFAAYVWNGPAR
ncbi:MAG: GNAT family N-acetyltransferase [Bryobacteraceae bacterium]|nr:GNAT family N-acetyltransferase [Bryobacteraceae bacterium]